MGPRRWVVAEDRTRWDLALTVALVVYVVLLAVATYGEIFENDAILGWFR